jgi:hypothetical protein
MTEEEAKAWKNPFHSPFSSRPILEAAAVDDNFRTAPIEGKISIPNQR